MAAMPTATGTTPSGAADNDDDEEEEHEDEDEDEEEDEEEDDEEDDEEDEDGDEDEDEDDDDDDVSDDSDECVTIQRRTLELSMRELSELRVKVDALRQQRPSSREALNVSLADRDGDGDVLQLLRSAGSTQSLNASTPPPAAGHFDEASSPVRGRGVSGARKLQRLQFSHLETSAPADEAPSPSAPPTAAPPPDVTAATRIPASAASEAASVEAPASTSAPTSMSAPASATAASAVALPRTAVGTAPKGTRRASHTAAAALPLAKGSGKKAGGGQGAGSSQGVGGGKKAGGIKAGGKAGSGKKTGGAEKLLQEVASAQGIRTCAKVGSSVWTAERNDVISLRELKSGALQGTVDLQRNLAWCLLLVPTRGEVWVGTQDGVIYVYSSSAPRDPLRELRQHCGGVYCLVASTAAGSAIAFSCSNDFTCNAWDAEAAVGLYSGHTGGVRCALSLGDSLFTGSDDHDVRCWDAASCESVATLRAHRLPVLALATASGLLFSSGDDGCICMWPLRPTANGAWAPLRTCACDASQPKMSVLQLLPVGTQLWSGCSDGTTRVWRLPTAAQAAAALAAADAADVPEARPADNADGGERGADQATHLPLKQLRTLPAKHGAGCQGLGVMSYVQRRLVWSVALDGGTAAMLWQQELTDAPDDAEALGVALAQAESARHLAALAKSRLRASMEAAALHETAAAHAREDAAALRAALAEVALNSGLLHTAAADADEELARERRRAGALRQSAAEQDAARRAAEAGVGRLTAELAACRAHLAEAYAQSASLQADLATADAALHARDVELRALREARAASEGRGAALSAALDAESAEAARRRALAEQLAASLAASEASLAQEQAESRRLREALSAAEAAAVDFRQALAQEGLKSKQEGERASRAEREAEQLAHALAKMTAEAEAQRQRAERAETREAELAAKLQATDYFKLDVIARELKKIDEALRAAKADAAQLQRFVKLVKAPDEATTADAALQAALQSLGWSRGHVRDVIQQCLNETQKYHVGADIAGHLANGTTIEMAPPSPPPVLPSVPASRSRTPTASEE